jgi:hypothetical protein
VLTAAAVGDEPRGRRGEGVEGVRERWPAGVRRPPVMGCVMR